MTNHGGGSRPSRYSSSRIAPPRVAAVAAHIGKGRAQPLRAGEEAAPGSQPSRRHAEAREQRRRADRFAVEDVAIPGQVTDTDGPARGGLWRKVAVVTGGGSGVGRAVAKAMAKQGANIVLADLDGPRLRSG